MPSRALFQSEPETRRAGRPHSAADACTVTILDHLHERTVLTLDSLICLMPEYRWNQIFYCVDALARGNKVLLRRHRFEDTLFSADCVAEPCPARHTFRPFPRRSLPSGQVVPTPEHSDTGVRTRQRPVAVRQSATVQPYLLSNVNRLHVTGL